MIDMRIPGTSDSRCREELELTHRRRFLAALAAFVCLTPVAPSLRADEPPLVAAAADLRFALPEIAEAFRRESGLAVKLAFGSSGNFYRQILQGAPFQVFLSADEKYPLDLAARHLALDTGSLYAVGRLALIVPPGSPLKPDGTLADLRGALAAGRVGRFAIANPEHAPYGVRAMEALQHAGLWEAIKPKLVLGENVSQAAQFALAGGSDGGIIAYSLALAPEVARRSRYSLIPQNWHQPLRQRAVLLDGAGDGARRFYAYLREPSSRAIFRRYGFVLPDEAH
jgi:molybdate transport system substrate-binding protein